jgi:hypothetical protein
MNRTSAEAAKMLITLERNLTIGYLLWFQLRQPVKAGLLPKESFNKCRVFSAIPLLHATSLGRFATGLASIKDKTERGFTE